jgi:DNA-binding transcriptional ArsR family regulator
MPVREEEPDAARLSGALKVLASPTRIRLLWALRVPKKAAELRIPAEGERGGLHAERLLSRTTLIEHLDVLTDAGLVERLDSEGGFVVNQQALFSVVEDFGRLTRIQPVVKVDVDVTRPTQSRAAESLPGGPRLVLVGGPREGQAFPLRGAGPWTVGRAPDAEVRLDYDPHVSRAQVVVRRDATGACSVEASKDATNPARVNFTELRPGLPHPLHPGTIISAGASRLVFQAA